VGVCEAAAPHALLAVVHVARDQVGDFDGAEFELHGLSLNDGRRGAGVGSAAISDMVE